MSDPDREGLDERVRLVASAYTDEAASYRDHWAHVLRGPGEALLDAMPMASVRRVLDIGAGVGGMFESIARRAPAATVIAIDRSEGMLRLARGYRGRAIMDGTRLAILPGAFDAAILNFVLFHFPEPLEALVEARAVLRAGGVLGVTVWSEPEEFGAQSIARQELDAHGAPECPPILARHDLMNTPTKLEALLRRAGLADTIVWSRPLDYRTSVEDYLARFTLRSLRLRLAALAEPERTACLARIKERLLALRPEGFMDRTPVIYGTARGHD